MANSTRNIKSFLKALGRMKVFWLCLLAVVLGLGFVSWVYHLVTGAFLDQIRVPVLLALSFSVLLLLLGSYNVYAGRTDRVPTSSALRIAIREFIAAIPLFVGVIAIFYVLSASRYQYILPVLGVSSALWLLLRFVLRRILKDEERVASPISRRIKRHRRFP